MTKPLLPRVRTFSSLQHRNFRFLWFSTLFSSSGMWLQQVSLGWLTFQVTGSAFWLGSIHGIRAVPLLVLGPVAGVVADRVERQKLLFFNQLFLMTIAMGFATIVFLDYARLWNIALFAVLSGVGWAFNMPVRQSLIPTLVPKKDLMNAYSLNSAGVNITRIIGPSLAGVLIAVIGIAGNFYIQACTYVGVAFMVWRITTVPSQTPRRRDSMLDNLKGGAKYIWGRPSLRSQMAIALVPVVIALPYVALLPIFAEEILGVGPSGFGLMMAAPGIGALVGTLGIASAENIRRKGLLLLLALIGLGGSLVLLALSRNFILSLLILGFTGAFQMMYMALNLTLLQIDTPDEFRGRVMGIYSLNQGLVPLGSLLNGAVAQGFGAPEAFIGMGGAVILLSLGALIWAPSMREA